jgi:hypothetical protein
MLNSNSLKKNQNPIKSGLSYFKNLKNKKKKLPISMKELAKFFLAWANQHPH